MKIRIGVLFCILIFFLSPLKSFGEAPDGIFDFPFKKVDQLYKFTFAVGYDVLDKKSAPISCAPFVYNSSENKLFGPKEFKLVPSVASEPSMFNSLVGENFKKISNGTTWVICGAPSKKITVVKGDKADLLKKIADHSKLNIELTMVAAINLNGGNGADVFLVETALKGTANRYPAVLGINEKGNLIVLQQPTNTD